MPTNSWIPPEPGLRDWTVYIDQNGDGKLDGSESAVLADANGYWQFGNLASGTYTIRVQPVDGFATTTPGGGMFTITVGLGSASTKNLFGEHQVKLAFGTAVNYGTGTKPVAMVVADFNNDKKLDVATVDSGGDVTIFLGNGKGTFAPGKQIKVGSDPVGIVAGDFNGDGKMDLAIIDQAGNKIEFLLGNGAGGFTLSSSFLTTSAPNSIAVADLNGDKLPDLIVTNRNSKTVTVFLNKGGGVFAAEAPFAVGTTPSSITVADLNGDKNLDLIVANAGSANVSVLLGNGKGAFAKAVNYPAMSGPFSVVVGDFNGDGNLDLLTANATSNEILFGVGNGTFGPPQKVTTGLTSPTGIVGGDFNNDGDFDVAVVGSGSTTKGIAILAGDGSGGFGSPFDIAFTNVPQAISAVDLNDDGKLDLIVLDGNTMSVILNKST
jgi:hypothetical protein